MFSEMIEYLPNFLFLLLFTSLAVIVVYLVNRGQIRLKLYYWNPFEIFEKYIEQTKQETGKIGIWFWIFIASGCSILVYGLIEGLVELSKFIISHVQL